MKKVWIDTDVAIGMGDPRQGFADVDDAWAMLHLFRADHIQVSGISTVFGNTDIENATRLATEIRDRFAPYPVEVYRGAAAEMDLKAIQSNEAVEALAQSLEVEAQHILAIGPATNIGLLLLLHPELASQILSITLVAGRRSEEDHFQVSPSHQPPFPDLNFDLDPDAFRVLLQSQIVVNLLPFEISHKVWLNQTDLNQVAGFGEAGAYLARESQNWLDLWQDFGCKAFNPFDILASAFVVSEAGFTGEWLSPRIEIHPDDTLGKEAEGIAFKPWLLLGPGLSDSRIVNYWHTPPKNFKADLFRYLAKS